MERGIVVIRYDSSYRGSVGCCFLVTVLITRRREVQDSPSHDSRRCSLRCRGSSAGRLKPSRCLGGGKTDKHQSGNHAIKQANDGDAATADCLTKDDEVLLCWVVGKLGRWVSRHVGVCERYEKMERRRVQQAGRRLLQPCVAS